VFDVGFWELAMVGLVALLVFGPERLPSLARTAGLWLGRARRFLSTVKADIEQELKTEELKRILNEQQLKNPLHEFIEDTRGALNDVRAQAEQSLAPPEQAATASPPVTPSTPEPVPSPPAGAAPAAIEPKAGP
jgi:sec-independent protein translocase protein TatB